MYSFFYTFRAHYDIHSTILTNPRTRPHHHGEQRRPDSDARRLDALLHCLLLRRGHAILQGCAHAVRTAVALRANASLQGGLGVIVGGACLAS